MVRLAYRHSYEFSKNHSQSWTLLVQLSSAHDRLMAEMDNLNSVTRGPQPSLDVITTGRWRISQASLRRRTLASQIFDFLADRLDQEDIALLKSIQSADQEMMRRSVRHVASWTSAAISADWKGYCDASLEIRSYMKAHIQFEKQALYPLLEHLAERGI